MAFTKKIALLFYKALTCWVIVFRVIIAVYYQTTTQSEQIYSVGKRRRFFNVTAGVHIRS